VLKKEIKRVGRRTCTSKLLAMPNTQRSRWRGGRFVWLKAETKRSDLTSRERSGTAKPCTQNIESALSLTSLRLRISRSADYGSRKLRLLRLGHRTAAWFLIRITIQSTLRLLFDTFRRTGLAMATVREFRQSHLLFPRWIKSGPSKGDAIWGKLEPSRVLRVLHNPRYAGVFVLVAPVCGKTSMGDAECSRCHEKNGIRSFVSRARPISVGRV
jgi:hypothetical protein